VSKTMCLAPTAPQKG